MWNEETSLSDGRGRRSIFHRLQIYFGKITNRDIAHIKTTLNGDLKKKRQKKQQTWQALQPLHSSDHDRDHEDNDDDDHDHHCHY